MSTYRAFQNAQESQFSFANYDFHWRRTRSPTGNGFLPGVLGADLEDVRSEDVRSEEVRSDEALLEATLSGKILPADEVLKDVGYEFTPDKFVRGEFARVEFVRVEFVRGRGAGFFEGFGE